MEELLTELAKMGPVIAVLISAIYYFLGREKKYEEKIEELNKEIREIDKENVSLLIRISATLEKLTNK